MNHRCDGLNYVSPECKAQTSVPQNVTALGEKVFKETMKSNRFLESTAFYQESRLGSRATQRGGCVEALEGGGGEAVHLQLDLMPSLQNDEKIQFY